MTDGACSSPGARTSGGRSTCSTKPASSSSGSGSSARRARLLVARRSERAGLIITCNKLFITRGELFGNVVAAAMIDRLVRHTSSSH
ncbi:hypothetical protein AYO39_02400 [Actinobacteria bacterium SCGC AG-212-D09]|nr:hypothetical protein AYO39_02400 [Actinobacteria bacterium SCGC AG-212-D09]